MHDKIINEVFMLPPSSPEVLTSPFDFPYTLHASAYRVWSASRVHFFASTTAVRFRVSFMVTLKDSALGIKLAILSQVQTSGSQHKLNVANYKKKPFLIIIICNVCTNMRSALHSKVTRRRGGAIPYQVNHSKT